MNQIESKISNPNIGLNKYISDESVKIVAVDLQDMAPIDGILRIKGDITKMSC